jgi:hypothetical protein
MLEPAIGSSTVPCDRTDTTQVQSPMRRTPLQSSFISITALAFRFEQLPTLGFGPPLDITVARLLTRGFPCPRFVPSSGDRSLSTVCSALQLAGLFHPAAELRTALPVQGLPTPHSRVFSSKTAAPSPLPLGTLTCKQAATHQAPRPRGFAPCRAACCRFGN